MALCVCSCHEKCWRSCDLGTRLGWSVYAEWLPESLFKGTPGDPFSVSDFGWITYIWCQKKTCSLSVPFWLFKDFFLTGGDCLCSHSFLPATIYLFILYWRRVSCMGDFACMNICVLHACSPRGNQKRLSDALRLELKKALICVGPRNQTCVIWKSSWCS